MRNQWLAFSISLSATLFGSIALSHYNWIYQSIMPKPVELQQGLLIKMMDIPRWALVALFTASLPGLYLFNPMLAA